VELADELVQLATEDRETNGHRFIDRGRDHARGDGVPVRSVGSHTAVAAS